MRLALGTAQFGFIYGVANTKGQVSQKDAKEILRYCKLVGIDTLDTAIDYGESEQIIGRTTVTDFKIVTKLPSKKNFFSDIAEWIVSEVDASIARLKVKSIYCLMLHRPAELLGPDGKEILRVLKDLKGQKVIENIGISVYSPDEFEDLFACHVFDIIQCPFNIIDRRLVTSGWLAKLKDLGVEVHVRSSFLQGLLLMSRDKIPNQFRTWDSLWNDWHKWIEENEVSPVEACLAFVLSHTSIDKVVVGVDTKLQLEQIVLASQSSNIESFPDLSNLDSNLINPSNWRIS